MRSSFLCTRCGHPRLAHDCNLVNEPATGGLEWIEQVENGYAMDILACMETPLPDDYLSAIEDMFELEEATLHGYVSPSPKEEDAAIEKGRPPQQYGSAYFLITPGGRVVSLD